MFPVTRRERRKPAAVNPLTIIFPPKKEAKPGTPVFLLSSAVFQETGTFARAAGRGRDVCFAEESGDLLGT